MKKKSYSDEFKRDGIRLQATSGKSVGEIERELRLSHNLLLTCCTTPTGAASIPVQLISSCCLIGV